MSAKKTTEQKENTEAFNAFAERLDALRDKKSPALNFKTRAKAVASYDDQIRILKEKRHISGVNGAYKDTLSTITYYRLKGYLRNKKAGRLSFETACRFHEFDAQIRTLLFYVISKIELYFRSQFSYVYCSHYDDAYAYLNVAHYAGGGYAKFLGIVKRSIEQKQETPFVSHYLKNYGGLMPLWVVTELLEFGALEIFYQSWERTVRETLLHALYGDNNKDRYKIANDSNRFLSWLSSCVCLRNICAHSGRFYHRPFTKLPKFPEEFKLESERKKQVDTNGKECKGDKDLLWGAVLALQFLYPNQDEWNELIVPQIKALLEKFAPEIGNSRLRSAIGFPDDWEYWLRFWRTIP